ncbi:hypothetical protein [Pseudohalioglobus lutimaris]|uniref:Uncharacterized protein n=1 Tax=Pseudohalioglobus lutimaris TaxID=1737061 RepID=A0A2N5X557_9GAMM|nr:hypothetical protein [Pseudohalioglobus lutimaris]PLW69625.1 hypothetical protein C0039_06340 [Pseudohalioglobus lutimaris]
MQPTSATRLTLLATLLLCMGLQGCSQWRYSLGVPLSAAQTPTPATTPTLTEALRQLGPPMRLSATADGYVLAWEHWQVSEDAIGLSLGALGADMLSLDWGRARMRGEFIIASFDHGHQLTSAAFSSWDSAAGGGTALQPFIGVSLVDVDDLLQYMPQHRWGSMSLERLPRTLNTQSRPDTGQSGVEQRGTPTGTGQRTLEMH